ncbi:MAG: purine-nucleoside phosphorylase, partial [Actinomycetota bacterium]|nr:purine-nucleoside phosphorylase [Actinomycetota bacterium]
MPIHLRAEPGDYAEHVLCPGDPSRATHIAETFF